MYKNFFGFKEKPFSLAPNPEYLYLGKTHDKTLAHLLFTISHGKKSLSLLGELGTGKTTLCKAFFGNLDESVAAAYISAHKMDAVTLLKAINYGFSIDTTPNDTKGLVNIIYEFLINKRNTGQKALVLIDEAQNLPLEALEQILLLANLETAEGKLLKIILVGQPELDDLLSSGQLQELGQRIIKRCQLAPLTFPETAAYIEHRISLAADKEGPPFDEASCRIIYEYSGGIPKLINIACEMALMNAFHSNSHSVTGEITRQAIKTLTQELPDKPERRPNRVTAVAILSALLVSVAVIFLYSNQEQLPENAVITKPASQTASVPADSKPPEPAVNKPAGPEMPPAGKQSEPAAIMSEGGPKLAAVSEPAAPAAEKQKSPEKPPAVKQNEPAAIMSEGGPKLAAVSEPAAPAAEKQKSPEKPAVKQNEPGDTVSETSTAYAVHAGTFNTASQANLLLNELRSLGFPSFGYTSLNKTENTAHVVVAGKYPSHDLARQASRSLTEKGIDNFIAKAKDSLKIPAGSGPIEITENKGARPEKPPAVKQSETGDTVSESSAAYSVHAGTFNTASQANLLLNNLRSLGFPSFGYTSLNKTGNTVHVVVAGKYQSHDLAKKASRSLTEKGIDNFIAKAKDSLKIPAGSGPIDIAENKRTRPETPLAADQRSQGTKISAKNRIYSVHAGTFNTASEADRLLESLKSLGFPSFMYTSVNKKGNTVYVVVAGKYQSYELAEKTSHSLNKKGHSNFVARAKDSLNKGPTH